MKSKVVIHEFNPVIYPYKVWICLTDNGKELKKEFVDSDTNKPIDIELIKRHEAVVYTVRKRKNPKYFGSLLVITEKKYFTIKTIAHESTHVADNIFEHIRESKVGCESYAYFVGWVAECCEKVKLNKE